MYPFLFSGTPFETPTYYALYLLGFLVAILISTQRSQRYLLPAYRAVDLGAVVFFFGVLGARLFHILFEAPTYYLEHPERVFYLWQGGFVFYGGLLLSIPAAILFLKKINQPSKKWLDLTAPAWLIGLSIGRVGCLSVGCCHGSATDWFWKIIFTNPSSSAPLHQGLHPTQIIESLSVLILGLLLWFIYRNPPKNEGKVFVISILGYAAIRFLIEFLRGDLERGFFGPLSTSQVISLVVVVVCGVVVLSKKILGKSIK